MKFVVLLILLIQVFGLYSASADSLKKIKLSQDSSWNPLISFVYSSQGNFIYMSGIFRAGELIGNQQSVAVPYRLAIADKLSGNILSPWQTFEFGGTHIRPEADAGFNVVIEDPANLNLVLKNLKQAQIVVARQESSAPVTHFIDLAELCETNPAVFQDADSDKKGCN